MNCKVIDGLIRYLTRVIPGGVLLSIARFRFTWFNKCKRFAGLIFKCKLEVGFITKNCQLFSGRGKTKELGQISKTWTRFYVINANDTLNINDWWDDKNIEIYRPVDKDVSVDNLSYGDIDGLKTKLELIKRLR